MVHAAYYVHAVYSHIAHLHPRPAPAYHTDFLLLTTAPFHIRVLSANLFVGSYLPVPTASSYDVHIGGGGGTIFYTFIDGAPLGEWRGPK
jgi:hypothetical protein